MSSPRYLALTNIRRRSQSLPAATEDKHRPPSTPNRARTIALPCPYRPFRCCIVIPSVDLGLVLVLVAVESQGTPASAAGTIALNKSFVDVSIETNLISVDIDLVPGYNLVAIPLSFTTTTRARDIAVAALPGGVQLEDGPITAILRWDVSYTAWLSNQPDVNKFEIEATRGYFIRLQSRIPGDKLTLTGRRYGGTPPHPRVTSTSPLIISGSVIAHQSSTLTTVDRLSFQVSLALAQIHRRDDYAAAERAIGAREGDDPGTIWGRGGPVFVFSCRGETL